LKIASVGAVKTGCFDATAEARIRADVALMCLHNVSPLPDDDVGDLRFHDVRKGVLFVLSGAMEKASVNEMGTSEG
jgi:hypothetical protein